MLCTPQCATDSWCICPRAGTLRSTEGNVMKLQTVRIQGATASRVMCSIRTRSLYIVRLAHSTKHSLCPGFKSFRNEVVVGPFPSGLSCIIGANGCARTLEETASALSSRLFTAVALQVWQERCRRGDCLCTGRQQDYAACHPPERAGEQRPVPAHGRSGEALRADTCKACIRAKHS